MPTSLEVTISASYTLETGQPRVSQCRVQLPMALLCRLIPPVKSSTFKFTLETNQDPPQLTDLFGDMLTQPGCTPEWAKQVSGAGANVMSFQYYNGVEATILVSKNGGKYRIQSNELEALWMVSHQLVERLQALYQRENGGVVSDDDHAAAAFEVFYQEPLPLADFFGAIDAHFAVSFLFVCLVNKNMALKKRHVTVAAAQGKERLGRRDQRPRAPVPRHPEAAARALQGPQSVGHQLPGRAAAWHIRPTHYALPQGTSRAKEHTPLSRLQT